MLEGFNNKVSSKNHNSAVPITPGYNYNSFIITNLVPQYGRITTTYAYEKQPRHRKLTSIHSDHN
jgi:hypothetical protein